jgi:hypothetical protein
MEGSRRPIGVMERNLLDTHRRAEVLRKTIQIQRASMPFAGGFNPALAALGIFLLLWRRGRPAARSDVHPDIIDLHRLGKHGRLVRIAGPAAADGDV